MSVSDEQVLEVTRDIWSTMIGVDVVPSTVPARDDRTSPVYTGCVQITGAWEGAVVIECPAGLANHAVATMLGIPPDECDTSDVRDMVGEVANMTGGNLKALLPGPSQLSLPSVTEGTGHLLTVRRARVIAAATVECAGIPFRTTVYESA